MCSQDSLGSTYMQIVLGGHPPPPLPQSCVANPFPLSIWSVKLFTSTACYVSQVMEAIVLNLYM